MSASFTVDFEKVIALVKETRPLLLNRQKAAQIDTKGRSDFVTQVDYSVQSFLCGKLAEWYPQIQVLGEEGQKQALDWQKPVWILDPVDGTSNLIHNYRRSCVALGLWDGMELVFGCVYNPFADEIFTAIRGKGAFLNNATIHVSPVDSYEHSLIVFGTTPYTKSRSEEVFERARRIFCHCEDIRRSGSAEIDLCDVACGRLEGFFEMDLKPWDFAAGAVILEEAGGSIKNVKGCPIRPWEHGDIVATNGKIEAFLLADM